MNKVFYENDLFLLYFSFATFEFYKQTSITDLQELSFEEFIREVDILPDKSQIWKRATIIEAGKLANILKEIA